MTEQDITILCVIAEAIAATPHLMQEHIEYALSRDVSSIVREILTTPDHPRFKPFMEHALACRLHIDRMND